MEENKLNEFQQPHENNLLTLNLYLFFFTFSYFLLFLSIFFPSHFLSYFSRTKHNLNIFILLIVKIMFEIMLIIE